MHIAADREQLRNIVTLAVWGANLDAREKDGETPLHDVVRSSRPKTIKMLLLLGADVNAQDRAQRIRCTWLLSTVTHRPFGNSLRLGRIWKLATKMAGRPSSMLLPLSASLESKLG